MSEADDRAQRAEARLRGILAALPDLMFEVSREGTYIGFHAPSAGVLAVPPEAFMGKPVAAALPPPLAAQVVAALDVAAKDGQVQRIEYQLTTLDGSARDFEARIAPTANGEFLCIVRDITPLKSAERELRASLAEKETLLKEVHHRVKNNLQVIASLINIQSEKLTDPAAREVFGDVRGRVFAIALLHERLYRSRNLARIDLQEYVPELIAELVRAHERAEPRVTVETEVGSLVLDMDAAMPVGLILHELVSNAFKHAFPPGQRAGGRVRVEVARRGGDVELVVADDGVGVPTAFDPSSGGSLGLTLVNSLCRQLDGRLTITSDQGTRCTVTFPEARPA